jgi:hypothetical protein
MGDRLDDGNMHEIRLDQEKIDSIPDVPAHQQKETKDFFWHLQYPKRAPSQGLDDITWLIEAIINLRFADNLIHNLSFAELTVISKSNGDSTSIRPIAMCETIRKLCFDVLLDMYRLDYTLYLLIPTMLSMAPMALTN